MRAIIALAALLAGLALLGSAQAADYEIHIDNFAFDPDEVTIVAGDSVTWVNDDDGAHADPTQPHHPLPISGTPISPSASISTLLA